MMMLSQIQQIQSRLVTYVKDTNGVYLFVSPSVLECLDIDSPDEILGYNDLELPDQRNNAPVWIKEDKRVMATGKGEYVLNAVCRNEDIVWQRTYKSPLFGRSGKIQGVSGTSVCLSESSLIPLTKQQTACLRFLALGNTYKQIGKELGLSAKTVEHYLDAVKLKLNCESRSDLILQAVERGLVGVF